MIRLVETNLYVGNRTDSRLIHDPSWAVVNTAKTIHCDTLGTGTSVPKDHPNYLSFEQERLLSFNWVDGDAQYYGPTGSSGFVRALDFIDKWYPTKSVLICCDQGQSRSPTVALIYLARRLHLIADDSYAAAYRDFLPMYPSYAPKGIAVYVSTHWSEIQ